VFDARATPSPPLRYPPMNPALTSSLRPCGGLSVAPLCTTATKPITTRCVLLGGHGAPDLVCKVGRGRCVLWVVAAVSVYVCVCFWRRDGLARALSTTAPQKPRLFRDWDLDLWVVHAEGLPICLPVPVLVLVCLCMCMCLSFCLCLLCLTLPVPVLVLWTTFDALWSAHLLVASLCARMALEINATSTL
jgi:hypothetical protein